MKAVVCWGNQLTVDEHSALAAAPEAPVILIEAAALCRKHRFHKQKIAFVLCAMREYADELTASGRTVHYSTVDDGVDDWFESLSQICREAGITELVVMQQSDKTPQRRLEAWCRTQGLDLETTLNTMFLTPLHEFETWAATQKRLQLEQFYRWQRRRLDVMVDPDGEPVGGRWNFDADNREPLPADHQLPVVHHPRASPHREEVVDLVMSMFGDHPGTLDTWWLPTMRRQANAWLKDFIDHRLEDFGVYEDAMRAGESFLHHSAISALLNVGLLDAGDVVSRVVAADVPLNSKEGFVRQVIGWREFMYVLYHHYPDDWKDQNFLGQRRELEPYWWFEGTAPEPPLVDVLARVERLGYAHHIERLMVLGNYMLLRGYKPTAVYDWFMVMFVDAYEWVMVPNVIGMSQYADGGIDNGGFATKPYISGSPYLQRMGHWWPSAAAAKRSEWTELYWNFLDRHEDKLSTNHRLAPLYRRRTKK